MEPDDTTFKEVNHGNAIRTPVHHGWLYRRAVLPVLALLRMGASPERLAWSIAAGVLIGINPVLGSTTVLCLAAAFLFRLNIAASQLGNHIVYPLQLLLFLPFIHLGTRLFHTKPLPLTRAEIIETAREHPAELIRTLWVWEWHALVVWFAISLILLPILVITLRPLIRRAIARVQRRQYPSLG